MKIALLQAQSHPFDYAANLKKLNQYAQQAKAESAALLVTPEMFLSGYVLNQQTQDMAKQFPLDQVQQIARQHKIALVVGGPRWVDDTVMNSAYFIDEQGKLLNHYDKTHMFGDVDRSQFVAGDRAVVITEYQNLKIAMLICYDVEFPETVRAAALAGADLVLVPTAQMQPYSFVNTSLIPTRAWENQVYVAYVNQIGIEADFHYVGLSSIASPLGKVLALASIHEEQLLFADVLPELVEQAQQLNPYLKDLRRDLF
ncbi:putative amidohydrolase [Acinetobacter calcoaceticus]|uniref:Putative amidohydrolase n=1 Tax=Acinetobacter calcoaceticus TaxID=471 RepID=A0A4R1Y467_ACICA|nr:putative amidohydrolase [Acinetobacter calcoaceticus]